jgi:vacuolar-type H+-ATPase catalytic subunit A/Vma1
MGDIVERLLNPANVFYEYAADKGVILREAADEIERLREALRKISNMGQTNVPDHWDFRVKAREIARAALGEKE